MRHDETIDNVKGIIQGETDSRVRRSGSRGRINNITDLLVRNGEIPAGSHVYVYCSDLQRAYDTGEGVHDRLWNQWGLQNDLRFMQLLRERGQGVLEGKTYSQALPILAQAMQISPESLTADAQTIYRLLYESDGIPRQIAKSDMSARSEKVVREFEGLDGVVIAVGHLISGKNYLVNLETTGNIMGNPPKPFQHYPNLHVIVLDRDVSNMGRYKQIRSYHLPNGQAEINNGQPNGATATLLRTVS